VLLVNGGDTIYLDRWMRESGLAELLPSLDLVYVGLSAGSLVMSPKVADDFAAWTPPAGGEGLGFVDFEIFPHVDHADLPENTTADAERWAAGLTGPGYAIDDATAIKVVDGVAEVISEGRWRLFEPDRAAPVGPR
jgi:dipeptidase E